MNEQTKEILIILQEEAAEVIQAISKVYRFGPDQLKMGMSKTNMEYLAMELGDLQALIELLLDEKVGVTAELIEEAKQKKFKKLQQWSTIKINK